ncbi:helix-turn-helix domain-containing protein [Brevibacillus fluminis]|uniref:helix-turn-helix domain-containing protein n=1 Tax=Brevibacillus TaxID=55080 RepID=UPI0030FAFE0D
MENMEAIGESIRLHRLKNGMSQEQLALNAGVNTSYIGQIERGEKNPTIKVLEKISSALGISLLALISSYESTRGGMNQDCRGHQPLDFLTPDDIKQCLLEVLIDNTNIVITHQGKSLKAYTNTQIEKGNFHTCPSKRSVNQLEDQEKNRS